MKLVYQQTGSRFLPTWDEDLIALSSQQCPWNSGHYHHATRAILVTFCLLICWLKDGKYCTSGGGLYWQHWCGFYLFAKVLSPCVCDTAVLSCPGAALQAVNVTIEVRPAEQIIASFWGEEMRTCLKRMASSFPTPLAFPYSCQIQSQNSWRIWATFLVMQ